jgi:hypothetical protein
VLGAATYFSRAGRCSVTNGSACSTTTTRAGARNGRVSRSLRTVGGDGERRVGVAEDEGDDGVPAAAAEEVLVPGQDVDGLPLPLGGLVEEREGVHAGLRCRVTNCRGKDAKAAKAANFPCHPLRGLELPNIIRRKR